MKILVNGGNCDSIKLSIKPGCVWGRRNGVAAGVCSTGGTTAALQHCSRPDLAGARPRGIPSLHSLDTAGHWTHTTPPLSSAVSQNQITEIFQISSCSCAVHCRPCSCRAPVINTGVERSLTRPHHDNTGADSRSRGHISRGSSPRV